MNDSCPIVFESDSEAHTIAFAERLAHLLHAGDVIALEGDLGAGKTRFVRGLARGLGHDERLVSSPTYVLAHEYATGPGAPALLHVDAYRVRSLDELDALGLDRALNGGAVLVVEWASRITEGLDPGRLTITIDHLDDNLRTITLRWDARTGATWAERLRSL